MEPIVLPNYPYFEQGNAYTGSVRADLRYRVAPQDDTLCAAVWDTDICFELAENKEEASFPLSPEGLQSAVDWLREKCGA